jgi:hypothetical protein
VAEWLSLRSYQSVPLDPRILLDLGCDHIEVISRLSGPVIGRLIQKDPLNIDPPGHVHPAPSGIDAYVPNNLGHAPPTIIRSYIPDGLDIGPNIEARDFVCVMSVRSRRATRTAVRVDNDHELEVGILIEAVSVDTQSTQSRFVSRDWYPKTRQRRSPTNRGLIRFR